MRRLALFAVAWWVAQTISAAFEPWEYTFNLTAQTVASPPKITINWPTRPVPQIFVRRKLPTDNAWGPTITLPGNATTYVDTSVEMGKAYEYEFQGVLDDNPLEISYGYICAGASIPSVERRGKVALIVDQTFAGALAQELETLRSDLVGDGWSVVRHDVSPQASPPQVKAIIRADYNADPANMRSVFIIGHVAVPYSGAIAPDMHPGHVGAWPADVYYGEMDGNWTDSSVNNTNSEFDWNFNVPGDGKFDQSTIPGLVELEVGRVDFHDMPSFTRGEQELLRNYLRKDHAFRHRTLQAPLRGLIRDNFGVIDGDAPAADAWRAFPALFGFFNYFENPPDQFFPTLANNAYLFAFACGGGDWEKADGVGSTSDFANGDPQAIFYLLHGSYFGDWNTTDNFLRAAIATPTYGLVSIWSSLPHWYFHHLALGESIGYSVRLAQNNQNGIYRNSEDLSIGQVHISMMGDPTLRPFPLAPPANVRLSASDRLYFSWDASSQAVDGYNLYWSTNRNGPFSRSNRRTITTTSYDISLPTAGHYYYMVKAGALQTTGSGSFNNLSQGIFVEYDSTQPPPPVSEVNVTATDAVGAEGGNPIVFTFSRGNPIDAALSVPIQFSGTATAGQDYQASTTVSFQPGASTATLTIQPVQDGINEMDETIIVSLVSTSAYKIGALWSATAAIQGSGQSQISGANISSTGQFGFTATGFANRPYRIESRTPTGAWQAKANATSGPDGAITYRESAAPSGTCQMYRVVWE
jgi:hypothetical protein